VSFDVQWDYMLQMVIVIKQMSREQVEAFFSADGQQIFMNPERVRDRNVLNPKLMGVALGIFDDPLLRSKNKFYLLHAPWGHEATAWCDPVQVGIAKGNLCFVCYPRLAPVLEQKVREVRLPQLIPAGTAGVSVAGLTLQTFKGKSTATYMISRSRG
jgi:hypothetical protein